MWICQKCKEKIEETFDVCWNCGTSQKGEQSGNIEEFQKIKNETSETLRNINIDKQQQGKKEHGFFAPERRQIKKGVSGGLLMMTIAVIWFFIGKKAGFIFYYPPILFLIGLYAFFKGLIKGNLRGDKTNTTVCNCSKCGVEVSEEAESCPQCGADLKFYECSACGTTLKENDKICPICGEDVIEIDETGQSKVQRSEIVENKNVLSHILPCENCEHYDSSLKVCSYLHFNVESYPKKYDQKCNGKYFSKAKP
jgi:RNA polymerase subunit RPABC4/transcription elongation factor Spt4